MQSQATDLGSPEREVEIVKHKLWHFYCCSFQFSSWKETKCELFGLTSQLSIMFAKRWPLPWTVCINNGVSFKHMQWTNHKAPLTWFTCVAIIYLTSYFVYNFNVACRYISWCYVTKRRENTNVINNLKLCVVFHVIFHSWFLYLHTFVCIF